MDKPIFPKDKPTKATRTTVRDVINTRHNKSYVILTTEPDLFSVLIQWLTEHRRKTKCGYVLLKGGYKMKDGSDRYITEDSVIVSLSTALEVWKYGWLDKQESVLHLYHRDRLGRYKAELCMVNDVDIPPVQLGLFRSVTKAMALDNPDGYTYRPDIGKYFIALSNEHVLP